MGNEKICPIFMMRRRRNGNDACSELAGTGVKERFGGRFANA
jgi:hypothetical protein